MLKTSIGTIESVKFFSQFFLQKKHLKAFAVTNRAFIVTFKVKVHLKNFFQRN